MNLGRGTGRKKWALYTWGGALAIAVSSGGCGIDKPELPTDQAIGVDGGGTTSDGGGPAGAGGQRLFVPAYIYPGAEWERIIAAAPTVGVVVANPSDGPGAVVDPLYAGVMARAAQAGIAVLGYVATDYGARSSADVIADINGYYDLYKPAGIFLSEGPMQADCAALEATFLSYANAARARDPQAFIALGTRFCPSYIYFTDVMILFARQQAEYDAFQPAAWMPGNSPGRFAHLVSEVPGDALEATVTRSRALGAGWIYVTDDVLPNPWDRLPSYFDRLVRVVSGR
ncbi:MAG TPA: spherulation-specific family 4 protein [Polyangia bacterium]|nr:spherulation-specific family 4 protein [Polyangia bacterium]